MKKSLVKFGFLSAAATQLFCVSPSFALPAEGAKTHAASPAAKTEATPQLSYHTAKIAGVNIFYREIGDPTKPTLLLLHGVPSSSRMYTGLMQQLGKKYHLIAPDYPGFGNSDAPPPSAFTYTFDNLANFVTQFTDELHLQSYTLFMQDYGAPVGMRVAMARPKAVRGLIFQNGNIYEDGLGKMWEKRRQFWNDRDAYNGEIKASFLSREVNRQRHVGTDPKTDAYDPDLWMDETAFLSRPGVADIQTELAFDYRTNVASYPAWQQWLREHQLPTLVIWGKYDPAFLTPGALAFKKDVPNADIQVLDAGHFAMDTRLPEISAMTANFMAKLNRR
jgi:pimeloyl-ACP methyl ester carboxylesterase